MICMDNLLARCGLEKKRQQPLSLDKHENLCWKCRMKKGSKVGMYGHQLNLCEINSSTGVAPTIVHEDIVEMMCIVVSATINQLHYVCNHCSIMTIAVASLQFFVCALKLNSK